MTLTGLATAFHKAALQFSSTNPHCRHWWRGSLRQVCSGCRRRAAQNARSIPDIHPSSLTVSNVVSISRIAAPANDQLPTVEAGSPLLTFGWSSFQEADIGYQESVSLQQRDDAHFRNRSLL